jgi:hypothetical protein
MAYLLGSLAIALTITACTTAPGAAPPPEWTLA